MTPSTVTITVEGVNDPPVLENIIDFDFNEDEIETITVSADDADGDALTYSCTQGQNITCSPDPENTNELTFVPDPDWNGSEIITVTVDDGVRAVDSQDVNVTVNPINDPPETNDVITTTNEEQLVAITLDGTDIDGDDITYTLQTQPVNGTLSNFDANNGTVDYTPNQDFSGDDTFTYIATDINSENSNISTVTITVDGINDIPTTDGDNYVTNEDIAVNINLNDLSIDLDEDPLTFIVVDAPENGSVDIDNNTDYQYPS